MKWVVFLVFDYTIIRNICKRTSFLIQFNKMGEAEVTPSLEKLIGLYRKKNKSSLDRNHVMCSACNSWLTAPIHLVEGGKNVCGKCIETIKNNSVRNISLENLLKGTKYPCKFSGAGCTVCNTCKDIHKHESYCNYKNISCFCEVEMKSKTDLFDHLLSEHPMETITLEKPVAHITVNLEGTLNIQLFKLQIAKVLLIVMVSHDVPSNIIKVMVWNSTNNQRNMKFMVKFTHDDIEYRKHGVVYDNSLVFDSKSNMDVCGLEDKQTLQLSIYFENYERIEPFVDYFKLLLETYNEFNVLRDWRQCSVCNKTVTNPYFKCRSNHAHYMCSECRQEHRCYKCDQMMRYESVGKPKCYPDQLLYQPCKYAKQGCFIYGKLCDINTHQNVCPMRPYACNLCNERVDINTYFQHMLTKHSLQELHDTPAIIKPGCISFNGKIVQFKFNYSEAGHGCEITKCEWSLPLIYTSEQTCLYDYTLEISTAGQIFTINGKTQSHTQTNVLYFDHKFEKLPIFTLTF